DEVEDDVTEEEPAWEPEPVAEAPVVEEPVVEEPVVEEPTYGELADEEPVSEEPVAPAASETPLPRRTPVPMPNIIAKPEGAFGIVPPVEEGEDEFGV